MKTVAVALVGVVGMYWRWHHNIRRNTPEFARLWAEFSELHLD